MPAPLKIGKDLHRSGLGGSAFLSDKAREKYAGLIDGHVNEDLAPVMDRFHQRLQAINDSTLLTPEGKADARQKAGREALAELDQFVGDGKKSRRRKLDKDMVEVKAPSRFPTLKELADKRGEDPSITFQRLERLRQLLAERKAKAPEDLRVILLDAAARNDLLVLVAADDDHPLTRVVSERDLSEATSTWIESQMPEQGRAILEARRMFDQNAETAKRAIATEAGIAADPKIVFDGGGSAKAEADRQAAAGELDGLKLAGTDGPRLRIINEGDEGSDEA